VEPTLRCFLMDIAAAFTETEGVQRYFFLLSDA
jgi:hypothetical protein